MNARDPADGPPERDDARGEPGIVGTSEKHCRQKHTAQPSAGQVGLGRWARIIGTPPAAPLYALIDRRTDGRPRIVSEHRDPEAARSSADVLRAAGDACEIVLITSIEAPA